jgi:hypothetical protein
VKLALDPLPPMLMDGRPEVEGLAAQESQFATNRVRRTNNRAITVVANLRLGRWGGR